MQNAAAGVLLTCWGRRYCQEAVYHGFIYLLFAATEERISWLGCFVADFCGDDFFLSATPHKELSVRSKLLLESLSSSVSCFHQADQYCNASPQDELRISFFLVRLNGGA